MYDIIHTDDYCVIVKGNDIRESGLCHPTDIIEDLWIADTGDYNDFRNYTRGEHYGKRIFYVYCGCNQIVEFLANDLNGEDVHPMIIEKGIVHLPFTDIHEILEYVLYGVLVKGD
jgi:hypothetical protein